MTQVVHVNRLNPKTTEQEFERFCTRFGTVIECIIYPENDKLKKRSGYVKFTSCQSAEKMYRQSREETFYIDQTSIDVELNRDKLNHTKNIKKSISSKIYTLNIQGQITDENELINYFNSKPLSIKFNETVDKSGQNIKNGAQVTFNDKDLVDKILKQNHEKYTIKLISNNPPVKRINDQDQSTDIKRSKTSQNSYSILTTHLESITKLTHDIYEENERLKSEKSVLTITLNQQLTKIKQLETEKTNLIESFKKTYDIAKCLKNQYKLREDEHQTDLNESNKKISDFEMIIQTANDALLLAKNQMQYLTNHITTLEKQIQELNDKYTESNSIQLEQQHDIELFFLALKNIRND